MSRSNLISKLALGTVQFGIPYGISNTKGQTPAPEVSNILRLAIQNGISMLDTASAYGNAEAVLGEWPLDKFHVVSKFINVKDEISLRSQLDKSLSDLRIGTLYGYLAHRPDDIIGNQSLWATLDTLKSEGKILKRGFSLNRPTELAVLLDKGFVPDIIQVPYNYLDRRFEPQMRELYANGCEIHCRSTFLQGLFFADTYRLPNFFAEVKPLVRQLQELGTELPGALLSFVLDKPYVQKVIMGVETSEQLRMNVAALDTKRRLPEVKDSVSENILMPMMWPAR